MAESRKVVRVFLASPGDLRDERAAAKSVVDDLNQTWLSFHGYHVELVGWEITVASFGRPQSIINRDLETCEYFLGILHKRWGTPPDKEGRYTSGFEEEFRSSVERKRLSNKPDISLLFKTIDESDLNDPGDQLKRVISFKNEIIEGKQLLFEEFSTIDDFQYKIRRCISAYIQLLIKREGKDIGGESSTPAPDTSVDQVSSPDTHSSGQLIPTEAASFLRRLAEMRIGEAENDELAPVDVARFRLLGSTLSLPQSDKLTLGPHDANIIYNNRDSLFLSSMERRGLLDAGLSAYEVENTPIWYWLSSLRDDIHLAVLSVFGTDERRIGALYAMRDIAAPIPDNLRLDRQKYLNIWLSEKSPTGLKSAALLYLSECGTSDDLSLISKEIDRNDYQTVSYGIEAALRISLRDGNVRAFEMLLTLQPETVSQRILDDLFRTPGGFSFEMLKKGLVHRCESVRLHVLRIMHVRGELDRGTAEALLDDRSREVRLEAMAFLVSAGRKFSEDDAKALLVHTRAKGRGIVDNLFMHETPQENRKFLDIFFDFLKSRSSDDDLKKSIGKSIFDRNDEFILYERRFSEFGERIRSSLKDLYKSEFEEKFRDFVSDLKGHDELIKSTRGLEDFTRRQHARSALDIICRKGNETDLSLVRDTLASGFVDFSSHDVTYLRRYGDWSDIAIIVAQMDKPVSNTRDGRTLLTWDSGSDDIKYQIGASAIYALSKGRLGDVLKFKLQPKLICNLLITASNTSVSELCDQSIITLLSNKDDGVRKVTSLRCIGVLSKKRLTKILNRYVISSELRYYNVIYWLDLGISMPRKLAISTSSRIIVRNWPTLPERITLPTVVNLNILTKSLTRRAT